MQTRYGETGLFYFSEWVFGKQLMESYLQQTATSLEETQECVTSQYKSSVIIKLRGILCESR